MIKSFWVEEQKSLFKERQEKLSFFKAKIEEKFSPLKPYFKIISDPRFNFFGDMKSVDQEYEPIVKKIHQEFRKRENSRSSTKIGRSLYRIKKRSSIHSAISSEDEKLLMKKFYEDCPSGHEIDHIIPISKHGQHSLENLQWLPKEINRKKNNTVFEPLSNYPHCRLDLKKLL